jgi:hypothetical protein
MRVVLGVHMFMGRLRHHMAHLYRLRIDTRYCIYICISKTHKILDHALGYLKGLEQLFKYCQARLVVIGKVYQNLSLRPLEQS